MYFRSWSEQQNQVSRETRDRDLTDFPKAAAIGQALKDLEFPTEKIII